MTITRVGSNQKYAEGWNTAFGGTKKATGKKPRSAASKAKKKTPSRKKAGSAKKSARKKTR